MVIPGLLFKRKTGNPTGITWLHLFIENKNLYLNKTKFGVQVMARYLLGLVVIVKNSVWCVIKNLIEISFRCSHSICFDCEGAEIWTANRRSFSESANILDSQRMINRTLSDLAPGSLGRHESRNSENAKVCKKMIQIRHPWPRKAYANLRALGRYAKENCPLCSQLSVHLKPDAPGSDYAGIPWPVSFADDNGNNVTFVNTQVFLSATLL